MPVLVITIDGWPIVLHNMASDCHGVKHLFWIIVAPTCAMGFTRNAKYLTEDSAPTDAKKL